jgi:glycosyltransferase involved in cell wall biosynthesis
MKISFIIPSRNNLKYLKWAYDSIRKNQGNHEVEICVADDFSEDGTDKWCEKTSQSDSNFKWIRNEGPTRQGLVILNDRLINEIATNDLCIVYHADMYLCPGALDAINDHMYTVVDAGDNGQRWKNEKTIVSLTRIEPPLHPPGPEKVLRDFGIEPEEFKEEELLKEVQELKVLHENDPGTTEGIFAPWAFWKEDFQQIGGHDTLFAPQSKEDSDIFNRFHLNGIKFIQTWEGFVYHMTSRGSRFNPYSGGAPGKNSDEWLHTTNKNMRNFIRKWGTTVNHDKYLKPIISPKYNIGYRIENCNPQLLEALEPWCDHIYTDLEDFVLYQEKEQPNTSFDLNKRLHGITDTDRYDYDDILVEINGNLFTHQDFQILQQLPEIIQDSGEEGNFELGNLKITISSLQTYEKELIVCSSQYVL